MRQLEKTVATGSVAGSSDDNTPGQLEIIQLDTQAVRRDIGPLRIIAVGFNIPNSWVAIASSLSIAIAAGGTVSIIYGTIVSCAFYACAAITLAELASVYPTAGGQYHFASILAPKRFNRFIAYASGIISTLSWAINGASVALVASQLITAFPEYFNGYVPERWHLFLIYQALNAFALIYNIALLKRTNWIHDAAFILTLSTFSVSVITCLARSTKQSSTWVWTNFEANTGWTPGISFLTGLITPCYMYGGLDAALHLAEETLNPASAVPRALMATVGIGFLTGFIFSVAMSYCITDLESLLGDAMPIYKLWRVATKSDVAGTVFLVLFTIIAVLVLVFVQQTTSRLIWAFARDRHVPANALYLDAFLIFLCGCLFLASTEAFNALLGSFLLLQMISFAIPAALLMYQKRDITFLPRSRLFRVSEPVGWLCNVGTVIAAIVETVFFTFPTVLPVDGANMNYAVVVLCVIGAISAINWFSYAKKYYQGPRVEGFA